MFQEEKDSYGKINKDADRFFNDLNRVAGINKANK
jgi:hypothetical protein